MAVQGDSEAGENIKTQFSTVEGLYKLLPFPEYNRQTRVMYTNSGNCSSGPPVKISFLCLSDAANRGSLSNSNCDTVNNTASNIRSERTNICYNFGRDLYVYSYKNLRTINGESEFPKPVEKRSYNKEDIPTCHDFNSSTATLDRVSLLVGLLGGQIQLFDPLAKDINKSFNSGERLIDKSRVTCIKWIPGSTNQFLVSHSSGQMYIYNEELGCSLDRPIYQVFKQGEGYTIYTCKSRSTRNPLYRWSIGEGSINEFTFSPCHKYLAVVSQDGTLTVFNFLTMDLIGMARSYYGGFLCVCWSPDGKYVVAGGEDDLISVWSFHEKRIVARCQGHKSWVTVVAFDPYTTIIADKDGPDIRSASSSFIGELKNGKGSVNSSISSSSNTSSLSSEGIVVPISSYRLGSVGQDTFLCLWDLKDDVLQQPYFRPRSSTVVSSKSSSSVKCNNKPHNSNCQSNIKPNHIKEILSDHSHNIFSSKLASLHFGERKDKDKPEKEHKRSISLVSRSQTCNNYNNTEKSWLGNVSSHNQSPSKNIGPPFCPRLDECPVLEPMVCKKIGHERLCGLIFREDSIITSCQDGCILTWCRPGTHVGYLQHSDSCSSDVLVNDVGTPNSTGDTVV